MAQPLPSLVVMRVVDFIVIYFAVSAPVLVSGLANHSTRASPTSISRAIITGLIWPLYFVIKAISYLFNESVLKDAKHNANQRLHNEVLQATNRCISCLAQLSSLPEDNYVMVNENVEHQSRIVRDSITKYANLSVTIRKAFVFDSPASKEIEFCRIAGRHGADLALGASCLYRRNISRLVSHQLQSKTELLENISVLANAYQTDPSGLDITKDTLRSKRLALVPLLSEINGLVNLLEDAKTASDLEVNFKGLTAAAEQPYIGASLFAMNEVIE